MLLARKPKYLNHPKRKLKSLFTRFFSSARCLPLQRNLELDRERRWWRNPKLLKNWVLIWLERFLGIAWRCWTCHGCRRSWRNAIRTRPFPALASTSTAAMTCRTSKAPSPDPSVPLMRVALSGLTSDCQVWLAFMSMLCGFDI